MCSEILSLYPYFNYSNSSYPLKGHTYLNLQVSTAVLLGMYDLLVDTML